MPETPLPSSVIEIDWSAMYEDPAAPVTVTAAAVADAGYVAACAVEAPERTPPDLFALPRLYIPDDPVWRFAVRIELANTPEPV